MGPGGPCKEGLDGERAELEDTEAPMGQIRRGLNWTCGVLESVATAVSTEGRRRKAKRGA